MSTHPLVDDLPELKAIDAKERKLREAHGKWAARTAPLLADYQSAYAAWTEASKAAMLRGEEPPPEPEHPLSVSDRAAPNLLTEERRRLDLDRDRVIAEHEKELLARLQKREAELRRELARRLRALLEPAVAELSGLLAAERRVTGAAGEQVENRKDISAADVAVAVLRNETLLGEAPRRGITTVPSTAPYDTSRVDTSGLDISRQPPDRDRQR